MENPKMFHDIKLFTWQNNKMCLNSGDNYISQHCCNSSNTFKPHFTRSLVVTSKKESNACSVFALQMCRYTTPAHGGPYLCNQLNTDHPDVENMLLSLDITTKVLVK